MKSTKSVGALFILLLVGSMTLLAGCTGQERFTYVMYDSQGCAFFVERQVLTDEAGTVTNASQAYYRPISKDWWKGDERYTAQIQRLSHDDLPTCPMRSKADAHLDQLPSQSSQHQ